jgi:hypothetical protein
MKRLQGLGVTPRDPVVTMPMSQVRCACSLHVQTSSGIPLCQGQQPGLLHDEHCLTLPILPPQGCVPPALAAWCPGESRTFSANANWDDLPHGLHPSELVLREEDPQVWALVRTEPPLNPTFARLVRKARAESPVRAAGYQFGRHLQSCRDYVKSLTAGADPLAVRAELYQATDYPSVQRIWHQFDSE